jgi:TonB-like protein
MIAYMRIPALGLLIAALFAAHLQGKEARDGKPVVYNDITRPDSPAEAAARKEYEKRFRIVDFREDKTFVLPKPTKSPMPATPQDASGRFVTGTVEVVFIVTAEGRVIEPMIVRSANQLLNEPMLKSIKDSQSTPARLNGSPVAILAAAEFRFEQPPAGTAARGRRGSISLVGMTPSQVESAVGKPLSKSIGLRDGKAIRRWIYKAKTFDEAGQILNPRVTKYEVLFRDDRVVGVGPAWD